MYAGYFGFERRPFASVPLVEQYFPGTTIESARVSLTRCIERGEGAGMVVGPSGTGKTLLCQVLADGVRDSFPVAMLSCGRLSSRRALLQAILYGVGQPYRGMDEGELRLALVDFLTGSDQCPQGIALLVDEAHTLPLRLLEEIRMLTNVARGGEPAVRLVLAGGCVLEERFASPKLDSFSQRLVARCYLEAFNRLETEAYIQAQIEGAGGPSETLFSEAACQTVHQATDGVPRLINQVCDHALLLAYADGRREILPEQIEEAWADLQQLPTPFSGDEPCGGEGGVIEFGGLDDSGEEDEDSAPPLRISPETNQLDTDVEEPAQQIERIEAMLGEADGDFEPAGSIGPEVELVFEDPGLAFREEFEEEEVIADRYAKAEAPPAAEQPPGLPGLDDTTPGETDMDELAVESEADSPAAEAEFVFEKEDVVPTRSTVPLRSCETEDADEEMIVVEDDYDEVAASVACPIVAVRRQEYGQLFAKLRRG